MNRLFYLAIIVTIVSCSKKNSESDEIPAGIQTVINNYSSCVCEPFIDLYTLNNQEVYVSGARGATCSWFPIFYNSKGEEIIVNYSYDDFRDEAEFVRNVWSCK
jgi:hypothetical protein